MAELPNLGKHCSFEECKQLDFLPFECVYCKNVFCLDHKFPDIHKCTKFAETDRVQKYSGTKSYECEFAECTRKELMPVTCEHCHKNFCLGHRHQPEHKCEHLVVKETPTKTAEHVQKIIDAKMTDVPVKPGRKKVSKTAAKVALMKMKLKAVGDKGIPESDRIFMEVYLPRGGAVKAKPLFFSKVWTIGRVIDCIADKAGITNTNNTASEKKLRLFQGEDGAILPTDKCLEELLKDDTVLNGGQVVLEYVTRDCERLDDVKSYIS